LRRELLRWLADPDSGGPIQLQDAQVESDGDVIEGTLYSPATGRMFPIVRGIPRFADAGNYAESFGLQWNRFARVQLDSHSGHDESRRRFDAETGWSETELAGKLVVDAGCGSGRFAEIASSRAAVVIAADLSDAVDAARDNLRHLPNVHVVQADIRALPFSWRDVDALYSIGVLQHTPDPVGIAKILTARLRPGSMFAFTAYGRRPWTKLNAKYLVRPLTSRLPPRSLLALVERLMPVLFPVTDFLFALPVLGRLFRFVIPVANYVDDAHKPRDLRYQEAVLDTFDMLSPTFDSPVSADELERALDEVGCDLRFVHRVPVVVRGVRRGS
jgi:SAM-dependent methyltransferase